MSNMSYCRFQNTSEDLRDCIFAMEDADNLEEMKLDKFENAAIQSMRDQCQQFLDLYTQLGGK